MSLDHGGNIWDREKRPIDFSANINPLGPSKVALSELEGWKVQHYPPPDPQRLKNAISSYIGVEAENITLGNGSMEIIKDFCSLFLGESANSVVLEPTFSEYARYSQIYGGDTKHVLASRDFEPTAREVTRAVDSDTRIIFICRPNNPTGAAMNEEELEETLDFAMEKDILLFLDEAFIEFSNLKSCAPRVNAYRNLFVLRSFTKFFALPGLRVGYGVGTLEVIGALEKIKPPWNVNVFAHDAALASLKDRTYMKRTRDLVEREREFLTHELEEAGIRVYRANANFLLLRYNWNSKEVKTELLNEGLLVRDCSNFHGLDTRYIRVCVRNRRDNLRLVAALKKQAKKGVKKGVDCRYYPCHFEGQDCTFCFCPFYPCGDTHLGGFIIGKKGDRIWSCKECREIHHPEKVKRIKEIIGEQDVEELDKKRLLEIKDAVM